MPSINRGWCLRRVPWMGILLAFWGTLSLAADIGRELDPVIVKGQSLPALLGKDTIGLRVYAYKSGIWSPVPFQLDEVVAVRDSGYYSDFIKKLDPIDELVFMAKDLGDQAGERDWAPDENAKQNPRYEIAVANPVTGATGYLYVYWSTDLAKSDLSYISYADETVTTAKYVAGQDKAAAGGLLTNLTIPASAGGDGIDLLDEQRLRLQTTFDHFATRALTIYIREKWAKRDVIELDTGTDVGEINVNAGHSHYKYTAGPIRVIRTNYLKVRIWGNAKIQSIAEFSFDQTLLLPVGYKFYPDYYEMPFDSIVIDLSKSLSGMDKYGVSLTNSRILLATAPNTNAKGMRYFTPRFPIEADRIAGLKIDQSSDEAAYGKVATLKSGDWPGRHWYGLVSDNLPPASPAAKATLFTMVDLRGALPAMTSLVRYSDYDITDGSPFVYGLNGIQLQAESGLPSAIPLILTLRQYVFPQVYNYQGLQELFDRYKTPVTFTATRQMFDIVPPGTITDLQIAGRADSTLTLVWTAVGDDCTSVRAATEYYLKYSTAKPASNRDWEWWGNAAHYTPPVPAAPGTTQSFTITGLQPGMQYYFGLRAIDEAGNASPSIAMITSVTTPVELSSFTAAVRDNRVELNWRTASESNNYGFAVERRFDKESAWQETVFIKGNGTTSSARSYSWIDDSARPGTIQYRLKQIDTDGSYSYSEPVTVVLSAPAVWALAQNYPNPFNPATTISYEVPANSAGRIDLTIYDLLGRRIRTLVQGEAQAGYYRIDWDGRDDRGLAASSGVYMYILSAERTHIVRKMIKLQ